MLVYSSTLKDDTHLGELIAHQRTLQTSPHTPSQTLPNKEYSRFNARPASSRLFLNRMFAFTALISINACTYIAAQALLQA